MANPFTTGPFNCCTCLDLGEDDPDYKYITACGCVNQSVFSVLRRVRVKSRHQCGIPPDDAGDSYTTVYQNKYVEKVEYRAQGSGTTCWRWWLNTPPYDAMSGPCVNSNTTTEYEYDPDLNGFGQNECSVTSTTVTTDQCVECTNDVTAYNPYWEEVTLSSPITALETLEEEEYGEWVSTSSPLPISIPGLGTTAIISLWQNAFSSTGSQIIYEWDSWVAPRITSLEANRRYEWVIKVEEYVTDPETGNSDWGNTQYIRDDFTTNSDGEIEGGDAETSLNDGTLPNPDDEGGEDIWTQIPHAEGRLYAVRGACLIVKNKQNKNMKTSQKLRVGNPILTEEVNEILAKNPQAKFNTSFPILPKSLGLGDRVEKVAQPIAKVIDKIAGTNIQNCGACQKRKEKLNQLFKA